MRPAPGVLAVLALPGIASAHGFDEHYDLPAPLGYFVAGACATVALSFVIAALFIRHVRTAPTEMADQPRIFTQINPALQALRLVRRVGAVASFALVVMAALAGTADPLMNLAPTLVWIIWWVGLSLVAACIGNLWIVIDPWRTLFEWADAGARKLGRHEGIALGWNWPGWLGMWPAVALLLAWSWFEVVFPLAAVPFRVGCAALAWTLLSLTGMLCFGRETWQSNADVFAIHFDLLGRIAPLAADARRGAIALRVPGAGLLVRHPAPAGSVAFVIAMLAIVLFDGLHGGQAWLLLEQALQRGVPQWIDVNGYFTGTVGLVLVWAVFLVAFHATCAISARLLPGSSTAQVAEVFAPTLVPIAFAYNIAHNFSTLLIQGQNAIPLLPDPLGRDWDLFGTAHRVADIGIVDARLTWTVAICAIVGGHVMAVWLAHRVALREAGARGRAAALAAPLTALMVTYTAISLIVIAEPMASFTQG